MDIAETTAGESVSGGDGGGGGGGGGGGAVGSGGGHGGSGEGGGGSGGGGAGQLRSSANIDALRRLPATFTELSENGLGVGRCRLTLSKPVLKAPLVSVLEATKDEQVSNFAFNFNLRATLGCSGRRCGAPAWSTSWQGLILVHIFSEPEPFLSLLPVKHPNTWDKRCSR